MRKIFLTIAAALAASAALDAQNINQSVQVTNDYENRFADIQKKGTDMAVPDSLYKFDYKFNYSVFESPYKGSYDFSPYKIQMTPSSTGSDCSRFYMRAGAGYSFHPLLTAVYSPYVKDDFDISIFAGGNGYGGKYYSGALAKGGTQERYDGYDYNSCLGVEGRKLFTTNVLSFQARYDGIYAGRYEKPSGSNAGWYGSGYHSGTVSADFHSDPEKAKYLSYDVSALYRYAADVLTLGRGTLGEHNFSVAGSVGPQIGQDFRLLLDFRFDSEEAGFSGSNASMTLADILPHVQFALGRFNIDAGARLDYYTAGSKTNFTVAPMVRADIKVLNGDMDIFASVGGGQKLLALRDLKDVNPFYVMTTPEAHNLNEKINAYLGVGGNVGSHFQYEAKVGAQKLYGLPLSGLTGIDFVELSRFSFDVTGAWKSERLTVDGNFHHFGHTRTSGTATGYLPSAFSGDIRAIYNWYKRIYAGLWLEGASARKYSDSSLDKIPGYVNLGLEGEYKYNSKLGFWLQAGNLIGMAIEKVPGVVEKGPYVTAGITLKIQ